MINNLQIPELLEKSSDFNPKEFQETLKNINLKLHFEYALLLITELVDSEHIKMINIHGGKSSNTFMLNQFGPYTTEKDVDKATKTQNMGNYGTIHFEDSFFNLKESQQKKVMNQIKKKSQQIRGSLRGLGLEWYDVPLNTHMTRMFNTKYQKGFDLTQNNKDHFVNEFLPTEWGQYRASILEQKHLSRLIVEKEKAPLSKNKI